MCSIKINEHKQYYVEVKFMNIKVIKKEKRVAKERSNIKLVYFLCIIFLLGIIIGSIYLKNKISTDLFIESENLFKNIDVAQTNYNAKSIVIESLIKNIVIIIGFWIVGLSIIGAPLLILYILFEGFSIGITISYIIYSFGIYKGYGLIYSSIYLPKVFSVLSIILLCNSAIEVTKNILKSKKDIKLEFIRHTTLCLITIILLIFSSFAEGIIGMVTQKIILSLN